MRRAALVAACLALAGCAAGTSNGFTATAPGGWQDRTDVAESRTGTDWEVVYEGTAVEGVFPILSVSRVESEEELARAAAKARVAVDRRFAEADPTQAEPAELDGEPALRFDYRTGDKRARYVTARHGEHLYAITLQSAETGFERARVVLEDYLRSWRWE